MKSTKTFFKRRLFFRIGFAVNVFLFPFLYRFTSNRTDLSLIKPTGPVLINLSATNRPLSQGIQLSKQTSETLNPTDHVAQHLLGNVAFIDGSSNLKLSEYDVVIGTADIFQDVLNNKDPTLTIFVNFGEADIAIALNNGEWYIWKNASEEFIEGQISQKIQYLKKTYRIEFDACGYKEFECYSQVSSCIVLESARPRQRLLIAFNHRLNHSEIRILIGLQPGR